MKNKDYYLKEELDKLLKSDSDIFSFIESSSLDGIWYWNLEKPEDEYMSPNFWKLFGYDPSEKKHLSSEWQDMINPDDLKKATDNFNKHIKDPSHLYDQVVRYTHKDGSTVWIRCRGIAIRDKDGRPIRMLGAHNDYTAVKKAEEQERAKHKQLSSLLNASLYGIMAFKSVYDEDGEIVDFIWTLSNKKACELVDVAEENLLGKKLSEIMSGNFEPLESLNNKSLFEYYKGVVETGRSINLEFYYDNNGFKEWFENKAVKHEDGFIVAFNSITDVKNTKQELQKSEFLWRTAIEANGDGLWDWNLETDKVYFSPQYKSMLGYKDDEILHSLETFKELCHPEHLDYVFKELTEYIGGRKESFDVKFQALCKDGSYKWIQGKGTVILKKEDGSPARVIGTHRDISSFKVLEDSLRKKSLELQAILDSSLDGIKVLEALYNNKNEIEDFKYVMFNQEAYKILNLTQKEAIDNLMSNILSRNFESLKSLNGNSLFNIYKEVIETGKPKKLEFYFENDAKKEWYSNKIVKRNHGLVVTFANITKEKELEESLHIVNNELVESVHALNYAQHVAHMGSWELNLEDNDVMWSDEVYIIFGLKPQSIDIDYKTFQSFIHPEDIETLKLAYEESLENKNEYYVEHKIVLKDGSIKDVIEQGEHIYDESGKAIKTLGTIQDITDKKRQEKDLNEKLQRFIDTQDSIVILTDSKELSFANKKFLDFFDFPNIESFTEKHNCICEFFEEDERFFHLGKLQNQESSWIHEMLSMNGRNRIVSIRDNLGLHHVFNVSIKDFDKTNYIVTFSDISDNMLEKFELEEQAIKDQLTKAYNRVFFSNNIEKILLTHRQYNVYTGIFFIDIDFFKNINDTFGHTVGDNILRKIVQIMEKYTRDDDKVIRWGGEEFIVITQANNISDVTKQADNLRSIIENHQFEVVRKVTCSFGCSINTSSEENIMKTIDKADQALYKAKEAGRNRVDYIL